MGTFGTGPLENDAALDLKDMIAAEPALHRRLELLNDALEEFTLPEDWTQADSMHEAEELAVGAAALISDVLHGVHHYTGKPEDDEDFRLDMLPVDGHLRALASRTVERAIEMASRTDIRSAWRTQDAAQRHTQDLANLRDRLTAAPEPV